MYCLQHILILRRNSDSEAILKSDAQESDVDKVPNWKIIISKISWYMPHFKLNDEVIVEPLLILAF